MATINEITSGSSYLGNSAIGGGYTPSVEIDVTPLQNLSYYTMAYNKTKWEQGQKDLEAKARELAQLTAYDLSTAIPEDSKIIRERYNKFYSWVQANPNVLDYKNNEKGWLEYNKRKNEFSNDLLNAKSRDITYKAGLAAIETETNTLLKAQMKRELDEQVKDGDLRKTITLQKYDAKPIKLPEVPTIEFDITQKDATGLIADRKLKMADQRFIENTSSAIELGLLGEDLDITSKSFTDLTPQEQEFKKSESERRKAAGRRLYSDKATILTEALRENIDPTTQKIDVNKVLSSNEIVSGSLQAIIDYNKEMEETIAAIKAGAYKDKLGKTIQLGVDGLNERYFQPIDFSDGEVSARDLIKVELRAKSPTTSYSTSTKELNNEIQRVQLAQGWARIGLEQAKINSASTEDLLAADGVLREITDIINKGDMPDNQVDVVDGNTGKTKRVFKIGDPNILQKFGNVDKEGTTTNVPDEARYNPKTNEIDLVYFQRDDNGVVKPTQTRGNYIRETKTLNSRTWANMVSQRTFSGQDRGKVNEIIQSVITKNGGDLYGIAQAMKGGAPISAPTTTTNKEIKRSNIKSKAESAGYTVKEYEKLLIKNGVKIVE